MADPRLFRLRVTFRETGRLALLSHLEVARALERSVRRAGLPYAVSQGFSPHMRIAFGAALMYDASGAVVAMGAGASAQKFVGVAARELKSALTYLDQSGGAYAPQEAVPVFMRGCVNVKCQNGVPKLGGAVYVRVAANEALPNAAVGGFEAAEDSTAANTVQLANCQWAGPADAGKVAELRILTMQNA